MSEPDLIIVGAGSAGCLMANRLSEQTGLRIAVIEPESTPAPTIDRERPSRWLKLIGSDDDWNFQTEANPYLANRRIAWPRGRGLGGSSRINAMIWFPPTDDDFELWETASGHRRPARQWRDAFAIAQSIVCPESPRWISEAATCFLEAAKDVPGGAPMIYSRVNRNGRRLDLSTMIGAATVIRATVDRILFKGDRAIGVSIVKHDVRSELTSRLGVILCGGAIATPAILMRSGIGDADELTRLGIDMLVNRPMVGKNLRDHLVMPVIFETHSKELFRVDPSPRDLVRWQALGTGPVSSNVAECGGLFADGKFQIHLTPTHYLTFPTTAKTSMMALAVNLTRPESSGHLSIDGPGVNDRVRIDPCYLAAAADREQIVEGVKLTRMIARRDPLAGFIQREVLPGDHRCDEPAITKSTARYAQTLYHPVGSCQFGHQSDSPIDTDFRVRGTNRLWAADASVLPNLPVGNPSAAVMTWAVVAADAITEQTA